MNFRSGAVFFSWIAAQILLLPFAFAQTPDCPPSTPRSVLVPACEALQAAAKLKRESIASELQNVFGSGVADPTSGVREYWKTLVALRECERVATGREITPCMPDPSEASLKIGELELHSQSLTYSREGCVFRPSVRIARRDAGGERIVADYVSGKWRIDSNALSNCSGPAGASSSLKRVLTLVGANSGQAEIFPGRSGILVVDDFSKPGLASVGRAVDLGTAGARGELRIRASEGRLQFQWMNTGGVNPYIAVSSSTGKITGSNVLAPSVYATGCRAEATRTPKGNPAQIPVVELVPGAPAKLGREVFR